MGLQPAQGDAYGKSADDPSDPIFSIRGKATFHEKDDAGKWRKQKQCEQDGEAK